MGRTANGNLTNQEMHPSPRTDLGQWLPFRSDRVISIVMPQRTLPMSTDPSRKEQRRQAALRELERRAQQTESQLRQAAADVNWGSATILDRELRDHIIRLGGIPREPTAQSAVEILTRQIKWPIGTFRSSEHRFREQHSGTPYESMTDTQVQDSAPIWCYDFAFATNGSFYPEWQTDFTAVNVTEIVPFGSDGHYFYLIGDNSNDPSDPLVYKVDHETVSEEPYNRQGATVGTLLELLITA